MPRYVALLRGVSPTSLRTHDLRACLEDLGFTGVTTVRASGNAAFTTAQRPAGQIGHRTWDAVRRCAQA